MSMNLKLITAGVLAMASFAASAQVTLYGGGATLPAQAYVGDSFYVPTNNGNDSQRKTTVTRAANPAFEGTVFGEVAQRGFGASQFQFVSYCQTGSGLGRRVLIGQVVSGSVANANGTCPTFATTPTGFGATAAQTVPDFAASDAPLSAAEYQTGVNSFGANLRPSAPVQFPVLAAAISVIFKNADVTGTLNLSKAQVCSIFNGQINNWNQISNTYPSKAIKVVYRSDGSGTTFSFANFLAANCPGSGYRAFDLFVGASNGALTTAPAGSIAASGNPGVANTVSITEGAIGYGELGDSLLRAGNGLQVSNVAGKAPGSVVAPTLTIVKDQAINGVGANGTPVLQAITPNGKAGCIVVADPNSYSVQPASNYPIVGVTYLLAYQTGNRLPAAVARLISGPYTRAVESNSNDQPMDSVRPGSGYAFLAGNLTTTIKGCVK